MRLLKICACKKYIKGLYNNAKWHSEAIPSENETTKLDEEWECHACDNEGKKSTKRIKYRDYSDKICWI